MGQRGRLKPKSIAKYLSEALKERSSARAPTAPKAPPAPAGLISWCDCRPVNHAIPWGAGPQDCTAGAKPQQE